VSEESSTIKTKGKTMSKGNKARELLDLALTIISQSDDCDSHAEWLAEAKQELGVADEQKDYEMGAINGDEIRIEGPQRDGVANLFYVERLPYENDYEPDEHFKARVALAVMALNGEGTLDIEGCAHCKEVQERNQQPIRTI
jgi:hypothetical protein